MLCDYQDADDVCKCLTGYVLPYSSTRSIKFTMCHIFLLHTEFSCRVQASHHCIQTWAVYPTSDHDGYIKQYSQIFSPWQDAVTRLLADVHSFSFLAVSQASTSFSRQNILLWHHCNYMFASWWHRLWNSSQTNKFGQWSSVLVNDDKIKTKYLSRIHAVTEQDQD